jgi:hypothetical protein
MFIGLSQKLIKDLTKELNSELERINIDLSEEDKTEIFANCDKAINDMNNRLAQLKTLFEK